MQGERFIVTIVAIITVAMLVAGVGACEYERQIILPQKMAEKSYCLQPVGVPHVNTSWVYAPCPKKAEEPAK